jgi:hypothetical protein
MVLSLIRQPGAVQSPGSAKAVKVATQRDTFIFLTVPRLIQSVLKPCRNASLTTIVTNRGTLYYWKEFGRRPLVRNRN